MILLAGAPEEIQHPEIIGFRETMINQGRHTIALQESKYAAYAELERQIEQCSVYVQIVGPELHCSTWLNHCYYYACAINAWRNGTRALIAGIEIDGYETPPISAQLSSVIHMTRSGEELARYILDWPPKKRPAYRFSPTLAIDEPD